MHRLWPAGHSGPCGWIGKWLKGMTSVGTTSSGLGMLLLPETIRDTVLKFFPSTAGESFMSVFALPGHLGTGAGIAVFVAWVTIPLVAAAVALKRRNA